jgi:hypothetical protein
VALLSLRRRRGGHGSGVMIGREKGEVRRES